MTVRQQFEAWWKRSHREEMTRAPVTHTDWLARDDIWGEGGYAQPCVHFDWKTWQAAFAAGRRK
jgi:hypothetical protein